MTTAESQNSGLLQLALYVRVSIPIEIGLTESSRALAGKVRHVLWQFKSSNAFYVRIIRQRGQVEEVCTELERAVTCLRFWHDGSGRRGWGTVKGLRCRTNGRWRASR